MGRWEAVACLWAVAMVVALIAPRITAQTINPRAFNGFRRYTGNTNTTADASVLVIPCSGFVAGY